QVAVLLTEQREIPYRHPRRRVHQRLCHPAARGDGPSARLTHGVDGQATGSGQPARRRVPAAGQIADRPPEIVPPRRLCHLGAAVLRSASVLAHGCHIGAAVLRFASVLAHASPVYSGWATANLALTVARTTSSTSARRW